MAGTTDSLSDPNMPSAAARTASSPNTPPTARKAGCINWVRWPTIPHLRVTVDSTGNVYVGGQVNGVIAAGQTRVGGQDAYVTKLDSKGKAVSSQQFGTTATDQVSQMATMADGGLVVASVENGHAIVRKYAEWRSYHRAGVAAGSGRSAERNARRHRGGRQRHLSVGRNRQCIARRGRAGQRRQCQFRRHRCLRVQADRCRFKRHAGLCELCRHRPRRTRAPRSRCRTGRSISPAPRAACCRDRRKASPTPRTCSSPP